jgi:Spy/CpxP family protein refolding chaperone
MEDKMKKTVVYGLLGVAALGGVALATVVAAPPIAAAIRGGGGLHGMCGRHRGFEAMSPEAAREHLQIATKWALRDIDASEEQRDRINAIAGGAVDDLFRLRARHEANHQAFDAQLRGTSIDRAALEEVRKSEIAVADEASKRLVQVLADVGDVLTPEQRQALMKRFHGEDED